MTTTATLSPAFAAGMLAVQRSAAAFDRPYVVAARAARYVPTAADVEALVDGDAHATGDVIARDEVLVADVEHATTGRGLEAAATLARSRMRYRGLDAALRRRSDAALAVVADEVVAVCGEDADDDRIADVVDLVLAACGVEDVLR